MLTAVWHRRESGKEDGMEKLHAFILFLLVALLGIKDVVELLILVAGELTHLAHALMPLLDAIHKLLLR